MSGADSTVAYHGLTTEAAHAAVAAAIAHASGLGIRINAAVVDASGVLMAFLRMEGAFLHSIDIAVDKAYTSASFGFATERWPGIVAGEPALALSLPQRPRLVMLGGGVPAYEGARCLGAIGVSGGSADQDGACAFAALAAIGLREQPH